MMKSITILLVMLIAVPAFVLAQPGPHGRFDCGPGHPRIGDGGGYHNKMDGRGPGIDRLLAVADEIGLTDDQKTTLKQMVTDFQMERVDHKADLQKARIKMRTLKRDEASESEVMRQIDEVARQKAGMQKMMYTHRQAVKNLLTEEQRDKLDELCAKRRKECRMLFEDRRVIEREFSRYSRRGRI